jgi:hypothetical protein
MPTIVPERARCALGASACADGAESSVTFIVGEECAAGEPGAAGGAKGVAIPTMVWAPRRGAWGSLVPHCEHTDAWGARSAPQFRQWAMIESLPNCSKKVQALKREGCKDLALFDQGGIMYARQLSATWPIATLCVIDEDIPASAARICPWRDCFVG